MTWYVIHMHEIVKAFEVGIYGRRKMFKISLLGEQPLSAHVLNFMWYAWHAQL